MKASLNKTFQQQLLRSSKKPQDEKNPCQFKGRVETWQLISEKFLTPFLRSMTERYLKLDLMKGRVLPTPKPGHDYVLYVHIPFCESLCYYCSFNRFLHEEEKARAYFKRLREEMRMVKAMGYDFKSMYIGGGTPTIEVDELVKTIDLARELFSIAEVSCETNPNHLIPEYVDKLDGRVDRMSVGVQSFDNDLLQKMGRLRKFGTGEEMLEKIRYASQHFPSLNVDMIFNFPSQTEEILRRDVEMVIASGANQTTFYPLMSSPSVERTLSRTVGDVSYSREARFYQVLSEELCGSFAPMSAWTFLRKGDGMLDEYIVDGEEYVGIGSGAFSYLGGVLYVNTFSLREYDQRVGAGQLPTWAMQRFNPREQMRYRFMMELFGLNFDKKRFKRNFGKTVEQGLFLETLFMWLIGAFSRYNRETIRLTPKGRYLSVVMMREFFAGVNNVRDQARQALSDDERVCAIPLVGNLSERPRTSAAD